MSFLDQNQNYKNPQLVYCYYNKAFQKHLELFENWRYSNHQYNFKNFEKKELQQHRQLYQK